MYDGSRTLCLSSLKSKNGGMARLSMITKTDNEIADVMNAQRSAGFRPPICISVSAIRNEVIVTERARTPLMSIENVSLFSFEILSLALAPVDD